MVNESEQCVTVDSGSGEMLRNEEEKKNEAYSLT